MIKKCGYCVCLMPAIVFHDAYVAIHNPACPPLKLSSVLKETISSDAGALTQKLPLLTIAASTDDDADSDIIDCS